MKLYLVQHGEACSKDVDPERPLTREGRQDVERMAAFLSAAGVRVQGVVHSGKLRAAQTAEVLAGQLAPGVRPEAMADLRPNDDPGTRDWEQAVAAGDLMVCGHLPFMGRLAALLVNGSADQPVVAYRPGSIVCLESAPDEGWRINWMLRPELLKA